MKKICIYLFILFSVFILYDNVNAGCDDFPGILELENYEGNGSNSSIGDFNSDIDDSYFPYFRSEVSNDDEICGPYVSYKDVSQDNNIYFIARFSGQYSRVSLLTTSNTHLGNSADSRSNDVRVLQAGVISNELFDGNTCPSYLKKNFSGK